MEKLLRLVLILGVISSAVVLSILLINPTPGETMAAMLDSAFVESTVPTQTINSAMPSPSPPTLQSTQMATGRPTQSPEPTRTPSATYSPYPTRTPTSPPVAYGPGDFPPGINPLTGLQVEDAVLLDRRPIAVKIVNFPRSVRPQWGLAQADIVFEYYIERGVTRYIAIFYGQEVERVGPIRSGRYFDEHIIRMFQSYFVFGSADDTVLSHFLALENEIVKRFVLEREDNFAPDCGNQVDLPLCRDSSMDGWNNLYVNTRILNQFLIDRGSANHKPSLTGMYFDSRVPDNGFEVRRLDLYFSSRSYNRWKYDPELEQYLRFQEHHSDLGGGRTAYKYLFDPTNGRKVTTDNIVLLFVPHEIVKSEPEVVKIHLLDAGPAYVFRNGNAYDAYWERPQDGLLLLYTPIMEPFPLKPGRTFFEVVGATSKLDSKGGHWKLDFTIP
jgi:hypothetical protein